MFPAPRSGVRGGWDIAEASDLDGDGFEDLILASYSPTTDGLLTHAPFVIWNNAGTLGVPMALDRHETYHLTGTRCDLDGDGRGEILLSPHNWIYHFSSARQAESRLVSASPGGVACLGDTNGDGRSELIERTAGRRLHMSGLDGEYTAMQLHTLPRLVIEVLGDSGIQIGGDGDFNGDGRADVFIASNQYASRDTISLAEIRFNERGQVNVRSVEVPDMEHDGVESSIH